jgi:hypothetical protein
MEDLQCASKLLIKALQMRERYMTVSRQRFAKVVGSYLNGTKGTDVNDKNIPTKATIAGNCFTSMFHVICECFF